MLVHREHLLGLFVSLLTFYRKGALFSIPFGFYWIINTPVVEKYFLDTPEGPKSLDTSTFLVGG
ncbi:hypothetical protein C1N77_11970 [Geobacillus thermoleovorans]